MLAKEIAGHERRDLHRVRRGPERLAILIERRDRVTRGEDDFTPPVRVEIHRFHTRHLAANVLLPEHLVLV